MLVPAAVSITGLEIFSAVVLFAGFAAVFALWFFVFRRAPIEEQRRSAPGPQPDDARRTRQRGSQ